MSRCIDDDEIQYTMKCEDCKHNDKKWYELPCDYCCPAHSGYEHRQENEGEYQMNDLISRQAAIDEIKEFQHGAAEWRDEQEERSDIWHRADSAIASALEIGLRVKKLPSAQPTLYGYNIEHLELIARVLQKEDLPPERIVEVLTDIGRIVAIVKDEFEETLRKAAERGW